MHSATCFRADRRTGRRHLHSRVEDVHEIYTLMRSVNMNHIVGKMNIVLITLDTLRYDVAERALAEGRTPNLRKLIPGAWQQCHSPATFTYAAHQAFFAGFLPTPAKPGKHERLFAADFAGSETTSSNTYVFKEADMVRGLQAAGYQTVCIGGVGFFNKKTCPGLTLPSLSRKLLGREKFGVTPRVTFRGNSTSQPGG